MYYVSACVLARILRNARFFFYDIYSYRYLPVYTLYIYIYIYVIGNTFSESPRRMAGGVGVINGAGFPRTLFIFSDVFIFFTAPTKIRDRPNEKSSTPPHCAVSPASPVPARINIISYSIIIIMNVFYGTAQYCRHTQMPPRSVMRFGLSAPHRVYSRYTVGLYYYYYYYIRTGERIACTGLLHVRSRGVSRGKLRRSRLPRRFSRDARPPRPAVMTKQLLLS